MDANLVKAMRAWNAGMELDEATKYCGFDAKEFYLNLEEKYGCASIPIVDFYDERYRRKTVRVEDMDQAYARWKGFIGHGALLREIIKREC